MARSHASRSHNPKRWPHWLAAGTMLYALAAPAMPTSHKETVFTYRSGESLIDTRFHYQAEVLRLALEKTRKAYGAYRLEPSPAMIAPRVQIAMSKNQFPNFFAEMSYDEEHLAEGTLIYVPFPVDRGIIGYRVCFTNEETRARLAKSNSLDDLRNFKMGLGSGWADVKIFRANGFTVVEGPNYEGLFQMLTLKRFDLFCRGVNEIHNEWEAHKDIPGLRVEESFAIAYPLPRFFFTNKANALAAERVEKGLLMAFQDGSLQTLWHKYFRNSVEFAKLRERRIFWLENPLLKSLDFNFRKYSYDPLNDTGRDSPRK